MTVKSEISDLKLESSKQEKSQPVEKQKKSEPDETTTQALPSPTTNIKPCVRELRAYSLEPHHTRIKLNQNENPWDAPHEIKQETIKRVTERAWSKYPEFIPREFHERIASFCGWKPEGVLAGNGSNELIQALLMVTIEPGKKVVINEPTFMLYRQVATVMGGDVVSVPLTPNLNYDLNALIDTVASVNPSVVIICSPNNPTGCIFEAADLAKLLQSFSGLVAVDEAYFEFSGQTAVPLLDHHDNLIVLRTFSKAMALAGLRVGYLLASPLLAQEIGKALLPYNLNLASRTAAEVAMEMHESKLQPLVQAICEERERIYRELEEIPGLSPFPTRANFMLVRSEMNPKTIFQELLRRDILVRDVTGYPMLQEYFRISVGTPEENDLLLSALRQIVN